MPHNEFSTGGLADAWISKLERVQVRVSNPSAQQPPEPLSSSATASAATRVLTPHPGPVCLQNPHLFTYFDFQRQKLFYAVKPSEWVWHGTGSFEAANIYVCDDPRCQHAPGELRHLQ